MTHDIRSMDLPTTNSSNTATPKLDDARQMAYSQSGGGQGGSDGGSVTGDALKPNVPPKELLPVPPRGDMRDPKVFASFFLDNFEIIDKSKNGIINQQEIRDFAQANHFKANPDIEKQVDQSAKLLQENYALFGGMAPLPYLNITKEDINYFEKIMVKGDKQRYSEHWGDLKHRFNDMFKSTHPTAPFVADPIGGLPRSDFSDGRPSDLVYNYDSIERIEHLLPKVQNGDRNASKLLQAEIDLVNRKADGDHRESIHKIVDFHTQTKLLSFERINGSKTSEGYLVFNNPFETADRADRKHGNVKHSEHLFYSPDAPLISITGQAASVFSKGTAFGEALASMAEMNPQKVLNMMKDNGDGTCTVTFPGAPNEPVRVPIRQDATAKFPQGKSDQWGHYRGTWPLAMSDAYEVFVKRHEPNAKHLSPEKFVESDREKSASERALKLLTGARGTNNETLRYTTMDGLHNTLTNIKDQKLPALMYDTEAKEYRAVLDYDVQSRTMQHMWGAGAGRTSQYDLYTAEGPVKNLVRKAVLPKSAFERDKLIYPLSGK